VKGAVAGNPWRCWRAGLAAFWLCGGLAAADELELTYLANEGVLLRASGMAVLVDALFGEGLDGYAQVAPDERSRLERAEPPYDAVTLVLATHRHRDHFEPAAVARYLAANPRAHFLSTPQALDELEAVLGAAETTALGARLHASYPETGVLERHVLGGVPVATVRLHHGVGSETQNLGFVVDLGGTSVLHVGDTEASGEELAPLHDAGVDVALLPVWFYSHDALAGAVRDLRARRRVAFHVAVPEAPADYHGPARSAPELARLVERRFPGVELLTRFGQRLLFSAAAGAEDAR
jgi:L-ascorbate metabolism protein UlaG (beta-lactamase superfamily)